MTIGQRIRMLRSQLELTQQEFGAQLNMTQSHIGSIEHDRRSVTDRAIADICREFHVDETWLRTGSGAMHKHPDVWHKARAHHELGEHLSALLVRYDELDELHRAPVRDMLSSIVTFITPYADNETLTIREISSDSVVPFHRDNVVVSLPARSNVANISEASTDKDTDDVDMVQVYRIGRVAAGSPIEAVQDMDDLYDVPASWRADYVLEVVGDSMEPDYPDGCLIAVRGNSEPPVGALVVAQLYSLDDPSEVDATFKRLRSRDKTIVLEAINEAYKDIRWPSKRTAFLGVVVGMVN